jgi:hypothetical protein
MGAANDRLELAYRGRATSWRSSARSDARWFVAHRVYLGVAAIFPPDVAEAGERPTRSTCGFAAQRSRIVRAQQELALLGDNRGNGCSRHSYVELWCLRAPG